jgi:hypothetical protein
LLASPRVEEVGLVGASERNGAGTIRSVVVEEGIGILPILAPVSVPYVVTGNFGERLDANGIQSGR